MNHTGITQGADAHPITEDDIANFLAQTPDFFMRHAELLSSVQLSSPHGTRAVSLAERQADMLREKIKGLEQRIMEMIRNGNENVMIADKLQRWTRTLLTTARARELPSAITEQVKAQFAVPQVAIKVWDVASSLLAEDFAQGVSDDAKTFASSITLPYCGINSGLEAVNWLPDATQVMSMALIPLRARPADAAFGMLVLASPDPQRFNAGMGTDFLERIGDLASAALSRLRA